MTAADLCEDLGMPDAPEKWMTRAAAAERLGVSAQTVDYFAATGRIRRWQNTATRRVWILIEDVERVKAERDAGPPDEPS